MISNGEIELAEKQWSLPTAAVFSYYFMYYISAKELFTSKLCLQFKKTVFIFILLQNLLVVEFSCDYCYLLFVVLQFSL